VHGFNAVFESSRALEYFFNVDGRMSRGFAEKNMSISTAVEEGGEKTGVESDERLSPHPLPGGFTGIALMVVLQSTVFLPGHFFLEAFCFVQTWFSRKWSGNLRVIMEPLAGS
jgi:hypothetical protein